MRRLMLLFGLAIGPAYAEPRYPQPVRSGDLPGRYLLQPVEQQHVLGRVRGVVRRDCTLLLVIDAGGVLGIGTHAVAVPASAAALLGEHVALIDLTPTAFAVLPVFDGAGATPVAADEVITMGLARPFH